MTSPVPPATIRSYLVHLSPGAADGVAARLRERTGCHVNPAVNRDVLIVVAEMPEDRAEAEAFEEVLRSTSGVRGLSLVSAFVEED